MPPLRVFASHDWGTNAETHKRVAEVVDTLRRRDIDVWFDETHMKGNILDAMCAGIDSADVVLVFVTRNYLHKVERGGSQDNVRREFMYAKDHAEKMVPIRFDKDLPAKWSGPVGMVLGSQLYVDLSVPGREAELVDAIRRCTPRTLWKTAVKRVATRPPTGVRQRVQRIASAMGDQVRDGEHVGVALDRILDSLVGSKVAPKAAPVCDKLAFAEAQLGL
jgi:hypothetical protein